MTPVVLPTHSSSGLSPHRPAASQATAESPLRRQAEAFETVFLAEMLRSGGLGRMGTGLEGGLQESPFEVFWNEALAKALMAAGGLGLSERIEHALAARRLSTETMEQKP